MPRWLALLLQLMASSAVSGVGEDRCLLLVSFSNSDAPSLKLRVKCGAPLAECVRDALVGQAVERIEVFDPAAQQFVPAAHEQSLARLQRQTRILVTLSRPATAEPPALIEGRRFSDITSIGGVSMNIAEDGEGRAGEGTGLVTWDSSISLARWLELHREEHVEGKRILELGSGTGVVGIAAALLGATRVLLTDLNYTLPNTRSNVDRNRRYFRLGSSVDVAELDWFRPETYPSSETFDLVIAADVVWVDQLVPGLVNALRSAAATGAVCLIGHQTRTTATDNLLFKHLSQAGFTVTTLPYPSEYSSPKLKVLLCTLEKPE